MFLVLILLLLFCPSSSLCSAFDNCFYVLRHLVSLYSSAFFIVWSALLWLIVMTTELMKCSSERFVNFENCFSSISLFSSFSTFSVMCKGIRLLFCCVRWNSDLNEERAIRFLDWPSLVHRCGNSLNTHLVNLWWIFEIRLSMMSLPIMFIVLMSTRRIVHRYAAEDPVFSSSCIVLLVTILLLLKHLNFPGDLSGSFILSPLMFSKSHAAFITISPRQLLKKKRKSKKSFLFRFLRWTSFSMTQLKFLYDEYIDWPKWSAQKKNHLGI